jgi:hypothetical protein
MFSHARKRSLPANIGIRGARLLRQGLPSRCGRRARLETRPLLTGSPAMTMGIVVVACFAARVAGVPR